MSLIGGTKGPFVNRFCNFGNHRTPREGYAPVAPQATITPPRTQAFLPLVPEPGLVYAAAGFAPGA